MIVKSLITISYTTINHQLKCHDRDSHINHILKKHWGNLEETTRDTAGREGDIPKPAGSLPILENLVHLRPAGSGLPLQRRCMDPDLEATGGLWNAFVFPRHTESSSKEDKESRGVPVVSYSHSIRQIPETGRFWSVERTRTLPKMADR